MRPLQHQVRTPAIPRRVRPWPMGPSGGGNVSGPWVVNNGALSFAVGSPTPFDLSTTGPAGYVVGGTYGVDPFGTQLPAGMTLSSPNLAVGSAGSGTAAGVVFSYLEPGALPVLTLQNNSITGLLPYIATAYPAEGAVPNGAVLVSDDETSLRSSVLSRWPDNSAQVVVLAGAWNFTATNSTKTVRLKPAVVSEPALTTSAVAAAVSSIAVNFGAGVGTLNSWGAPDRVWWANSQVICARYRLAIPGKGVMEAVIDVHAFAGGQAFVEVVIENSRMNSASPSKPATQTYTSATVSVNGTTIATVSSPTAATTFQSPDGSGTYAGGHEAFRAWYCSAKVVGGTVTALTTAQQQAETFGIAVTHDTASMQAHPLFHKIPRASTKNMATAWNNATFDTYQPWRPCRVRAPYMGGVGDYEEIGPHTLAQTDYMQTGNQVVARAVLQHALGVLCENVNYRDSTTNTVTPLESLGTKSQNDGSWPFTSTEPAWEIAHCPTHGMMAFMLRPSPCYIEIAQKQVVWNKQWTNLYSYTPNHPGNPGPTGTYGLFAQPRGKAWAIRSHSHALFITPDSHPWKAGGKTYLHGAFKLLDTYRQAANERLGQVYDYGPMPTHNLDYSAGAGFQNSPWMTWFITGEVLKVAGMRYLSGAEQTFIEDVTTWLANGCTRYINESANGEWRFHGYYMTIGTVNGNDRDMGQLSTWGEMIRWAFGGLSPPTVSGYWLSEQNSGDWSTTGVEVNQTANVYVKSYVYALAMAKERGVAGASTAWATMEANIINLETWKNWWNTDARWGADPRA
jgi:hypothetical protein